MKAHPTNEVKNRNIMRYNGHTPEAAKATAERFVAIKYTMDPNGSFRANDAGMTFDEYLSMTSEQRVRVAYNLGMNPDGFHVWENPTWGHENQRYLCGYKDPQRGIVDYPGLSFS